MDLFGVILVAAVVVPLAVMIFKAQRNKSGLSQAEKGAAFYEERQATTKVIGYRGPNHVMHLLLTVVTLGFYLPVWLIIAVSNNQTEVRA